MLDTADCLFVLFFCRIFILSRNPGIRKLTATAAETRASISWESEGPDHVNFYLGYDVAGSKKQFHCPVVNLGDAF